jgi:hypothetical protein
VLAGGTQIDRPAIVVRVQQHNNDELVQYLLSVKQEESLGAAVNHTLVIRDRPLPNQQDVATSIIKPHTIQN